MLLEVALPDAEKQGASEGQSWRWQSQGWSEMAGLLAGMTCSFDRGAARTMDNLREAG